jgi:release factor glutamine methyltransferase
VATTGELLRAGIERLRAAGSETPRLDAEVLLGYAIGADRTAIVAHPDAPVGREAHDRYLDALARRETGEPVAYIRGFKEFHGNAFAVDPRGLIPRPETERLVELAEREIMARLTARPRPPRSPAIRVADVGTGSGAIAVSVALAIRRRGAGEQLEIIGTDAAPGAIQLARENAVGHAVADRVTFLEADLLPPDDGTPFDLVLANLPYVRSDAIDGLPVAASFEPRDALDGGPDGLAVIRRLLARLPGALAADGIALLEIGSDQDAAIRAAVADLLPGWSCRVETDLAGLPRVAVVTPPGPPDG